MRRAEAFSPCNITGFFRIHADPKDPLRAGSTGASVTLSAGVMTRVTTRKARRSTINASFNNQPLEKTSVSAYVAKEYLELDGGNWSVDIMHTSPLPTGCGYGTSGAGALSLSLALNEAIGLSLDRIQVAQLAHVSEVVCKTGLGTVSSVYSGGFALRTVPGAPGVGKITKLSLPRTLRVVSASFGPISTSKVIGNYQLMNRVNVCGKDLIQRFDTRHASTSFVELSRKFSECLSLMSQRLRVLINRLDSVGFKSSMVMLGESLFCITPSEEVRPVASIIQQAGPTPTVTAIDRSGAHLL